MLVMTNLCCVNNFFFRDKCNFVATKLLLQQAFDTTKDMVCHDKSFVASKMMLMAAPTNDRELPKI